MFQENCHTFNNNPQIKLCQINRRKMTHHFIDNYSLAADKLVPRSDSIFAELRSSSRSTSTC